MSPIIPFPKPTIRYTILLDPHLNLAPAYFVTIWNHLAAHLASAGLAAVRTDLLTEELSPTDRILLASAHPLVPDILHQLIDAVALHCGVAQPLHFLEHTCPNGSPLILVTAIAIS